jgi:SnoaL-like domain
LAALLSCGDVGPRRARIAAPAVRFGGVVAAFPGLAGMSCEPDTGRYRIDVFRDPHVRWSLGVPNLTSHAWRRSHEHRRGEGLDCAPSPDEDWRAMSIAVLRQMFEQMVENKDPTAIDRFYHPSFVMFSNGVTQDFEAFAASHRTIYATPISYSVEYDEQAWVEATDKVAGRVWIMTSRPGESPTRIEVVLIAAFTDGRISRVWETTWPSWNTLPAFETY